MDEKDDIRTQDEDTELPEIDGEADGSAPEDQDSQTDDQKESATLEKRFKDTQAAFTRIAQEKKALEKELAEVKGKVDAVIAMRGVNEERETEPAPFSYLDDDEAVGSLLDDPKNVRDAMKKVVSDVAKILDLRDRAILGELERRDPTTRELGSKIAELRKDPDYEGFSDRQLAVLAKKQITRIEQPDEADDDDGFVGSVGGGRRVARRPANAADKEIAMWEKRLGYDRI